VHPVLCLDSRAPCCALEKGAMVPRPVGVPVSRSGAARQETTGRSGQGKCMHARPEPVSRLETMRRGKRGGTATAFSCRIAEGGRPFRCRLIPVGWLAGSGRRGGSVPWPDTGTLAGRGSSAGDDDDGRVRVPGEERAERGHEAWEKAAVGAVDEGIVPPGHGTTGAGGGGRGAPGTVGGDGGVRLERVDRRHDVGFGDEVAGAAGQLLARLLTGMRSRGKAVGAVPIPGATPTRLDYSYRQPLSWFT
jgi:hypothetical protein